MQKVKVPFKYRLEYLIFYIYLLKLKLLPLFFFNLNKKIINFFFKKFSKRHSKIITKNLKTAFPQKTEKETHKLKNKVYNHFSSIFIEIIYLYLKRRPNKIALNKNRGLILFSAHFGNWELIPYIFSKKLKLQIYGVAKEMNNPLVEKTVKNFRKYMGCNTINKKGSIKKIIKLLENKNILYFLIDQNTIERESVFVDFFSTKVSAVTSVSQLHLKKGIPILPVFLHYENDKIVLEILECINFKKTENYNKDVLNLTQKCTTIIEEKIREYPEQWFWFHDRWKTKPKGEINDKR
jgi:KDO2-lipid IV(A) lauroyltransferase